MGFLNKLKEVASDGVNNIITSLPAKSVLVKQVASVNYENMLVSVNTLEESVPASKSLIAPIQLLNEASAAYNQAPVFTCSAMVASRLAVVSLKCRIFH